MHQRQIRILIYLIVSLTVIRGLIYALVIPVDRTPDEFHHFGLIKAKHLELRGATAQEKRAVTAEIGLARYYLLNPETQRQRSVADFASKRLPAAPSSSAIYYLFNAWVLNIFSLETVQGEVYLLRGVSVLLGTLVVVISFWGTRLLFPHQPGLLIGVPLFITFIPQVSAMNGSINNDKLAEVFVAVMFVVMVSILKKGFTLPLGGLLTASARLPLAVNNPPNGSVKPFF
jgi:hypothetical protein